MKILVTIPRGYITDTFLPANVIEKLNTIGTIVYNTKDRDYTGEELAELLPGVDVCLTGWGSPFFDEAVLQKADSLKLIAHTGGSVAVLVGDGVYDRGIKVISGNWLYAESVAESVIAYALCSLRELPHYSAEVQVGRWHTDTSYNEGLLDQTVGLIGFGMVAKYLVGMLKPFRAKIRVYDPYASDEALAGYGVQRATLAETLQCKVISIHAAKTPATYHMITKELLETIPDGSLLVNTARGSIIDEAALAGELAKGRFKAALDVYEEEPLPLDSGLRGLDNAFLMPHMGGPTVDRRQMVTLALIEEIENFSVGKPLKYSIDRAYALSMTR